MFTMTWMRATTVLSLLVLAVPCLGQDSGYDRMDGDFIKPSKREQPNRNFNLADKERVITQTVRRSANPRAGAEVTYTRTLATTTEDDRLESRAAKDRKAPDRFRQPADTRRAAPALTEESAEPGESEVPEKGYETTEAADVAVGEPVAQPLPLSENQLVYCSNKLHEFHWDVDCPMLKNVKPTRLTYKVAREARYTECTACGGSRQDAAPTR